MMQLNWVNCCGYIAGHEICELTPHLPHSSFRFLHTSVSRLFRIFALLIITSRFLQLPFL